ncbi:MAG TPA: RNA polymerase sigma factor [Vicinamibacterales bacterium]|nr:RNA polymerase sigma factor [Vicinamibacterales bacterium]
MGTATMQETGLPDRPVGMQSTIDLLERFKKGDKDAVNLLVERSIPPLKRWARGRLPQWARSLAETQDLVQNAVLRALPHLKTFEAKHPGALQAYLRQAVNNHIRDEIRKVKVRPPASELSDDQPDEGPSPLERAIGQESLERYEAALKTLREVDREAIIARVELQQSYDEIAIALGKPSADAARMAVVRALRNLLKAMASTLNAPGKSDTR